MSKRKDIERAEAGKSFRNTVSDKVIKVATKIANRMVGRRLKNKTFDQKAAITRRFISMVGVPEMRRRVIEGMEEDVAECIAKGMTDEEILQPCKDSPNYIKLLDELGLNFDHIEAIIKNQRGKK